MVEWISALFKGMQGEGVTSVWYPVMEQQGKEWSADLRYRWLKLEWMDLNGNRL